MLSKFRSLDDAPGEAFDKVARALHLTTGYIYMYIMYIYIYVYIYAYIYIYIYILSELLSE